MNATRQAGWMVLLALGVAGSASAAGYEVNGVQLGMTRQEVEAALGDKIQCTSRTPTATDPSQASCVNPQFAKNKVLSDTFAGQKTVIRYHILDGKVARISFLGFPSMAFNDVVKKMEPTYGKAEVVSSDVRIAIKSELVDQHATWRNSSGDSIVFDKFSPGNLDRSYLNFYAASYPKPARP